MLYAKQLAPRVALMTKNVPCMAYRHTYASRQKAETADCLRSDTASGYFYIKPPIACQYANYICSIHIFSFSLQSSYTPFAVKGFYMERYRRKMKKRHTILTITGSDGTGGAGIQADIKTISALGGHAVSVITSITMQNTLGIQSFYDIPADIVAEQITALMDDLEPTVIKIGMVRNGKILNALIEILHRYKAPLVIYDPVVTSSRGDLLMTHDMIKAVTTQLLPLCSLVIMKQSDAMIFLNRPLQTEEQRKSGIAMLLKMGCKGVMLHGGNTYDTIAWKSDGETVCEQFPTLLPSNTHGLGSSLSSAIAYHLCQTQHLPQAIADGKAYIRQQLSQFGALKGRSGELYNEFIMLISEHCRHNNDVGFYAQQLNVSSRYLAQVTKRIAQKTPKSIIEEQLFAQSKLLLDTTSKTVQEIAYTLGFHSQSHFTKFFKKIEGTTPSIYRIKQMK